MGAKDRRAYHKEGTSILRASQGAMDKDGYRLDAVRATIEDLLEQVQNINQDYQECQDNLADSPGLLVRWEEDNYDAWMEWQSVESDLESLSFDWPLQSESDVARRAFDEAQAIWERGEI